MPAASFEGVAMTHLPKHPFTGLTALGLRRDGRPIWPVLGGSEPAADPATPPTPSTPPADPPADPDPDALGDGGKKALAAERARAKELEKELAAFRKEKTAREEADKTEAEKRAAAEQRAVDAELRALRLEVASEKGLTAAQARRLQGATRDELLADADDLLANFGAAAPSKPTTPAPDPSQGSKGSAPAARPTSLGQAVGAALKPKA